MMERMHEFDLQCGQTLSVPLNDSLVEVSLFDVTHFLRHGIQAPGSHILYDNLPCTDI
jgi:hypothetical protein